MCSRNAPCNASTPILGVFLPSIQFNSKGKTDSLGLGEGELVSNPNSKSEKEIVFVTYWKKRTF